MECIAMLLAGGQGSRLGVLTKNRAKPVIPFGGKYRIIDFTLSNCINSGISTVGVLTQYQPLELNEYIGNGQPWDLDRLEGGVQVLPPYQRRRGADWYKGTANAIYQNMPFIERYNPEFVLVLSGDHIYKMDYSKMLDFHKSKNADCTISVIEVPREDTSRYGIINADEDGRVLEFEEKPQKARSNMASMGVYIFSWKKLKKYLEEDDRDKSSENDFGKNVIPHMISVSERLFAYPFHGYWKDVGTIESLWEANMDLLNPESDINLGDSSWRIYARSPVEPPHYIGPDANVTNSVIAEGCIIEGEVHSSILFCGTYVAPGAVVTNSIVMPDVRILKGARVRKAIIAEDAQIGESAIVGYKVEDIGRHSGAITVVGNGVHVADKAVVMEAQMLDADISEVKAV
jgi:glucose-1-phosphate adenylyltransferase